MKRTFELIKEFKELKENEYQTSCKALIDFNERHRISAMESSTLDEFEEWLDQR